MDSSFKKLIYWSEYTHNRPGWHPKSYFTNPVGTRGVLDVCLGCGGVGGECVGGLDQRMEG